MNAQPADYYTPYVPTGRFEELHVEDDEKLPTSFRSKFLGSKRKLYLVIAAAVASVVVIALGTQLVTLDTPEILTTHSLGSRRILWHPK
jgi:hypothetical protein